MALQANSRKIGEVRIESLMKKTTFTVTSPTFLEGDCYLLNSPVNAYGSITSELYMNLQDPFDFVGYSQANAAITIFCK
jgi:hypothetical protein